MTKLTEDEINALDVPEMLKEIAKIPGYGVVEQKYDPDAMPKTSGIPSFSFRTTGPTRAAPQ